MRLISILLFTMMFIPYIVFAQQPWERITPTVQENNINSIVKIPGSGRLMAVCNRSTIITSDDGGEHWDLHFHPGGMFNDFHMSCIRFFNDSLGFILGNDYSVLRTTNGGNSWEVVYTEPYINQYAFLYDIDFCNESTGFAVGSSGKMLRTGDGGQTWTEVETGITDDLKKIEFLTETTGFAPFTDYVVSRVLKTTDGGNTWSIHENPMGIPDQYFIKDIRKVTGNNALISTCTMQHPWVSCIFRSTNAGYIWYQEATMEGDIKDFAICDSLRAVVPNYVFYYGHNLWETTDGGDNWHMQGTGYIYDKNLRYYDESEIINAGWAGSLQKSYDGGLTWMPKNTWINDFTLHEVHFPGNTAYGVALDFGGALVYYMVKSTDGGVTWTDADLGVSTGTIDHLSADTALRLNEFGMDDVIYTTDAWQTFSCCELEGNPFSEDICVKFLSPSNGVATVGNHVYYSAGNTFSSWPLAEEINSEGLTFTDIEPRTDVDAFICGGMGSDSTFLIKININEPSDFLMQYLGSYGIAREIVFVDDTTGFIGCSRNVILKTSDGGLSWAPVTITSTDSLDIKRIKFPVDSTGYAIGKGQYYNMLKTTDRGNTWFPVDTYQTSPLLDLHFTDANNGYIYGESGLIMHTSTGGVVGSPQLVTPAQTLLITPNPTRSTITLSTPGNGRLLVYTLSGEQVAAHKVTGLSTTLNISFLARGVYLVKYIGNTGVMMGKVVKM